MASALVEQSSAQSSHMRLRGVRRARKAVPDGPLLDMQPEILDAIASHLSIADLSALAITCRKAAPLHAAVIAARIQLLRELTCTSHVKLLLCINRLPHCPARETITQVVQSAMGTFRNVCSCNEHFLRLSRAVALRGLVDPFNNSPVEAARLARTCCQTCDHVTHAVEQVGIWLEELHALVRTSNERGESITLLLGEEGEQQPASPPDEAAAPSDDESVATNPAVRATAE